MRRLVLILLWVGACRADAPVRQTLAVLTTNEGGAFVIWRSTTGWVSFVDETANVLWSRRLAGRPFPHQQDRLVLRDRLVVRTWLRQAHGRRLQIETFSKDGTSWLGLLGTVSGEHDATDLPGHLAGRELQQTFSDDTGRTWLVGFDLDTGVETRRVALPFSPSKSRVRANDVVFTYGPRTAVLSSSGTVEATEAPNCFIGDHLVIFEHEGDDRYRLVPETGPAIAIREPIPSADLRACARYDEDYVLMLDVGVDGPPHRQEELWIVDPKGNVRCRIPINRYGFSLVRPAPGFLPRYLPVIRSTADHESELVMIDLQRGAVAWSRAIDHFDTPILAADRWYTSWGTATIGVFDAETGNLIAAKRWPSRWEQVQLVQEDSVDERALWMFSSTWQAPSAPLVSRVDGRTLEYLAGAKVSTRDVRHESPFALIPQD